MMKKLKVLHLASFIGNLGDNANHNGVRKMFAEHLKYELEYSEIEIRDYYFSWKKKFFDENFVDLVNQHDLLMIGGGNFFDLWIEESHTGTTISISQEIYNKIKTPILFFGLGCDPYKGTSEKILNKFRDFLNLLISSKRAFISVRNDGSYKNIAKYIGESYLNYIHHVPDGGFFTEVEDFSHPEIYDTSKVIAVNIAGDMLDVRFKPQFRSDFIDYPQFIEAFTYAMNKLLLEDKDLSLVFVPHIFRDIKCIGDVLEGLKDEYRRKRVSVAPYLQGSKAHAYIFDIYRKVNLSIGMRFHTNVCSIGFNTPTIALINQHQKLTDLYEELELEQRTVDISRVGFQEPLIKMIKNSLSEEQNLRAIYATKKHELENEMIQYCNVVNQWMEQNF